MNIGIILAGGVGSRVGANRPKQFIMVEGKPVIAYTIEAYQEHSEIDAIEVVCHKDYKEYLKELVLQHKYNKVRWIAPGGKDFQESVMNGLNSLKKVVKDDDIVAIHYGASPFVSQEIITDNLRVCKEKGNATSACQSYLLTGSNDGKQTNNWLNRDNILLLNCPHSFKYGYIQDVYKRAKEQGLLEKIEPHTTSLLYALGDPIYVSKGNQTNIKITTKEDLDLFEGYVLMRERRKLDKEKNKDR